MLQNAIGKITSKIIARRLTKELSDRKLVHRANEGFLNEKGTANAIHTLTNLWEDAKENKKTCLNMLYDVSGAYDEISHEQIKRGMEILHLPEELMNFVMEKLNDNEFSVKTKYGKTKMYNVRRGVAQGCPLSPIIYIIAMNPLHVGLEHSPIYGGANYGYEIKGEDGQTTKIASKGFADDTAVVSGTERGMMRLAEWVNLFCIINRITMNASKSMLFGRMADGSEMRDINMETISQIKGIRKPPENTVRTTRKDGAEQAWVAVKPTPANSSKIKYLGIRMNMDLDWGPEIAEMNKLVGRHRHIIEANELNADQATCIVNSYLRPKLEYKMRFVDIDQTTLAGWDAKIRNQISDKIYMGMRIKKRAIEKIMNIKLPSEYYTMTQITSLIKTMNDETGMGRTTRARMK